jgi:hypothetical protein
MASYLAIQLNGNQSALIGGLASEVPPQELSAAAAAAAAAGNRPAGDPELRAGACQRWEGGLPADAPKRAAAAACGDWRPVESSAEGRDLLRGRVGGTWKWSTADFADRTR